MTNARAARMPAVFVGHGSPMNALQHNRYTDAWRAIGTAVPRPRTVLAISAHWLTRGTAVTAMARPETIHDFGGFPQELFDFQYPAGGDPELAARVRDLLAPAPIELDHAWGLDHGTWSVLTHIFPHADVPVVQLSLDENLSPVMHYDLAARLAPLRDEGVLILASGNVVHNLRMLRPLTTAATPEWATRFNAVVRSAIERHDHALLTDYAALGQDAVLSAPTVEHYLPLLYVLALQGPDEPVRLPVDGIEMGSISMLSVVVG